MTAQDFGAQATPSPKILQAARVEAAGASPWLARELARIAYPWDRRDDVSALMAMTASRCASAGAVRS